MKMTGLKRNALRVATLALCTITVGALPLFAQDTPAQNSASPQSGRGPGGRGRMDDRRIEMMTKELSLTPDQVTSIKAIEVDSRKQSMALREDTSVPQDQKRDKMMAIREAATAKTRALLNDDQKTKFDAMETRMRDRMRNGRGGGGPGGDGPPPAPQQ